MTSDPESSRQFGDFLWIPGSRRPDAPSASDGAPRNDRGLSSHSNVIFAAVITSLQRVRSAAMNAAIVFGFDGSGSIDIAR